MNILTYKHSGVYAIVNCANGKRYIGSAKDIRKRWDSHIHLLRKNKHHSMHLQRAWNKYGEFCFNFIVLEECDKDVLDKREQYYMDLYKPEYNILPFAHSTRGAKRSQAWKEMMSALMKGNKFGAGYRHTEEAKKKISAASKGNKYVLGHKASPETKAKMSATQKVVRATLGFRHSEETKAVIAEASRGNKNCLGRKASPETREKMSMAKLGKPRTTETKAKISAFWKKKRDQKRQGEKNEQ